MYARSRITCRDVRSWRDMKLKTDTYSLYVKNPEGAKAVNSSIRPIGRILLSGSVLLILLREA